MTSVRPHQGWLDDHMNLKKQGFGNQELRISGKPVQKHLLPRHGCCIGGLGRGWRSASEYNGSYLEDCNIVRTLTPWAADPGAAKKLWEMSEEMVGEKSGF